MRVELQPAFILHSRPFRDSSIILDCLTENHGRLSLLAKGARSPRSKQRQLCQPFRALLVSWQGKSNLKTLIDIEAQNASVNLQGKYLFSGFYVNELLLRALPEGDPCAEIYARYRDAMQQLQQQQALEPLLRQLELGLVEELGYAIDLQRDSSDGAPLEAESSYRLLPEQGLVRAGEDAGNDVFQGEYLYAMARSDYSDPETLRQAKRLTRQLLRPIIGDKPLKSRELFTNQGGKPNT